MKWFSAIYKIEWMRMNTFSWILMFEPKNWNLPLPWNLRRGFTMATNRSNDIATSVNTDTPVEKSFINSDIMHIRVPQGHDSTVYTTDTNDIIENVIILRLLLFSDIFMWHFSENLWPFSTHPIRMEPLSILAWDQLCLEIKYAWKIK